MFAHAEVIPSTESPNIIIILADDMAWRDPGFMGSSFHKTPQLDALAQQSTVYTQAYAASPSCTPSRAALISGQYPSRFNIFTVGHSNNGADFMQRFIAPDNNSLIPDNIITLPQFFKTQGYETALIGKWHINGKSSLQHFDTVIGSFKGGHVKSHFAPWLANNEKLEGLNPKPDEYLTDSLNQAAVKYIEQQRDKPFVLLLSHYAPHTPYQAKADDIALFNHAKADNGHRNPTYAGMLAAIDRGVGHIVQSLKQKGLLENTLIIFTSDNGGDHVVTSAAPLRGEKSMIFEGGIRVPFFIYYPKKFPASQNSKPVTHLDIFPSLADLINAPVNHSLDGKSLLENLSDQRSLFWYTPVYAPGYSPESTSNYYRQTPAVAIRQGSWKMIRQFETDQHLLFNLATDPAEKINLYQSSELLPTIEKLDTKLDQFLSSLPESTKLKPNPHWQSANLITTCLEKLKLQLQQELFLLTDWLAGIYWGDKQAQRSAWIWLAIIVFLLSSVLTALLLKLKKH